MSTADFILASKSPARLQTLRNAGTNPRVLVSGVDEAAIEARLAGQSPATVVTALARAKALAVLDTLPPDSARTLIIGADSMLECQGELLGKPHSPQLARERWEQMNGGTAVLHTGHAVVISEDLTEASLTSVPATAPTEIHTELLADPNVWVVVAHARTVIHFAQLSEAEIAAYVATGEPLQVAGAFTIDGLGGAYVTGVEGDPHSVVGISLPLLRRMLGRVGFAWHQLWNLPPA